MTQNKFHFEFRPIQLIIYGSMVTKWFVCWTPDQIGGG